MLEFILEIVLSALGEWLWWLVIDRLLSFDHRILIAAAFAFLGGLYGGLSLLFAPRHLIHNPSLRFWYVVLAPVALALLMAYLGARRKGQEQRLFRFDYFVCAYAFTLTFVLMRAAGIQ